MSQTPTLTPDQLEAFGAEMDAIRAEVLADLGERDTDYIDRIIRLQRALEVTGRGLFLAGFLPPAWLGGVAALSLSKILDNMEIGHNVMHGQYDWTNDPALSSRTFEWDNVSVADHWRELHNFQHHTFTNILGKDRDIGYGIIRITEDQPWSPVNLGNPLYALALAALFEYGVMAHEPSIGAMLDGEATWADTEPARRELAAKVRAQVLKDYALFPALTGPSFLFTLAGNATANLVRNLWAFTIIFCGHFPEGSRYFTEEEVTAETRGGWYYRQVLGSANIEGGPVFHVLSGNLSHQIEHHLFPDLPAHRYAEIAPKVRAVCERYGLPYNTGGLGRQFGSVVGKIVRLALPDRPVRRLLGFVPGLGSGQDPTGGDAEGSVPAATAA